MGRFILGAICFFVFVTLAAWLSLKRPDLPFNDLEKKYAVSASNFITLPNNVRVHYLDSHKGMATDDQPSLVLLHGYASSSFEWNNWLKHIKGRYRLIAIDLPAHGLTQNAEHYIEDNNNLVGFLNDTVSALKLTEFSVVGNSLGGTVAWQYSLKHPDKVQVLILISADGWEKEPSHSAHDPMAMDLKRHAWLYPIMRYLDMTPLLRAKLEAGFVSTDRNVSNHADRLANLARAPGHRQGLAKLAINPIQLDTTIANNTPLLILQGEKDKIVPRSFSEKFQNLAPNSTEITYEMSGHFLQIEIPKRSLQDTLDFLENLNAPPILSKDQQLESVQSFTNVEPSEE